MAGHAQLKFVMTECSKTQIRLTGLIWKVHILSPARQSGAIIRPAKCCNVLFPLFDKNEYHVSFLEL